jgi:hypothetical protein
VTPEEIAAVFDAVDITGRAVTHPRECPQCGTRTTPSVMGHASLCLRCTVFELGESLYDLAIRREFRLSRRLYHERLEAHGSPGQDLHFWITPRSRLKR